VEDRKEKIGLIDDEDEECRGRKKKRDKL